MLQPGSTCADYMQQWPVSCPKTAGPLCWSCSTPGAENLTVHEQGAIRLHMFTNSPCSPGNIADLPALQVQSIKPHAQHPGSSLTGHTPMSSGQPGSYSY